MDGLHFEGNGRFCGRDETIRVTRFSFGGQRLRRTCSVCVWSALRVGDENDDEATKLFPTHRLDVTTSGVVVVAKNSKAAGIFSKILRDGFVEKQYLALTENPRKLD